MKRLPTIELSSRDRRLLGLAVPLVAVLVVVLAFRALHGERDLAENRLDHALEDIAWLQSVSPEVRRCDRATEDRPLASRGDHYGLSLASSAGETGGEIRLDIAAGHGNRVLALVADLICRGGVVRRMDLERLDNTGTVKGVIIVSGPVT